MLKDVNRFKMFPETLVAYSDHALVVTGVHGHIRQGLEGFYRHQTRFLSRMTFQINGRDPRFVSANPVDPYSFVSYYLAPSPAGGVAGPLPDDPDDDGGEIVEKGLEIQLNRFVGGGCHQDVYLTNHTMAEATIELAWDLEADYADLTEVVEGKRQQEAPVEQSWCLFESHGELAFRYGHPELPHATVVRFPRVQEGPRYEGGRVVYRLTLRPREPIQLCMSVVPIFCGEGAPPTYDCDSFHSRDTVWDQARERWFSDQARLSTSNRVVQEAWDRAVGDLGSLPLFDGEGPEIYTPAAGLPIYQALFGRDTLTTAWQSTLLNPLMLEGTIRTIAKRLGNKYDDRYDEQPGRVIHQHQLSPLSMLGLNPFLHYYGDYAGPGMFLIAIAWHFAVTGDKEFVRSLKGPIQAVLDWIDRDADRDGDGFYEYATKAGRWGTKNQGWKDSGAAILYPDGRMVENPIAVVEVQGYVYAAKQLMGFVFMALGDVASGVELLRQAADLKRRFNQAYWLPEQGIYALALDPDKKPVATVASNIGHCLACGIVDHDKAAAAAGRLMAPDMFSGWGIRTLSSEHPAYNPFTYHLGSVWPSENASIALGFKRYGLNGLVSDLAKGIFDAATLFYLFRLPEVIGGHRRDQRHPHPGIYPQSNAPQAWSSSAVILLVQAILGLVPLAPMRTLILDPDLPEWLPEVTLEDLPVGQSRVSLQFRRDGRGRTDYRVLKNEGRVRVVHQPPPDSLTTGAGDRLSALFHSLLPHHA